jgi:hypothetical protein
MMRSTSRSAWTAAADLSQIPGTVDSASEGSMSKSVAGTRSVITENTGAE